MERQHMIRGQVALLPTSASQGIPVINVENACATASTAFHMAAAATCAPAMADVALAVGTEKMFSHRSRTKMFGGVRLRLGPRRAGRRRCASGWSHARRRRAEVPPTARTSAAPLQPVHETSMPAFSRDSSSRTLRHHAAPARSGDRGKEPHGIRRAQRASPSTATRLTASTQVLAAPADHLSADAADVLADLRRRRRSDRVQRRGPEAAGAATAPRAIRVLASVLQTGSDRAAAQHERHVTRARGPARLRTRRRRSGRHVGGRGPRRHCDGRDHPDREPGVLRVRRRAARSANAATPASAGAFR